MALIKRVCNYNPKCLKQLLFHYPELLFQLQINYEKDNEMIIQFLIFGAKYININL